MARIVRKVKLPVGRKPRKKGNYSHDINANPEKIYQRCINGTGRFAPYKTVWSYFETEQPIKSLHAKLNLRKSSIHTMLKTLEAAHLLKFKTTIEHMPYKKVITAIQNKEFIKAP
jgi:hypothetical protein